MFRISKIALFISVVFFLCHCRDDDVLKKSQTTSTFSTLKKCKQFSSIYIECYKDSLIKAFRAQGWEWNESEYLNDCNAGCNDGDVPTALVDCYLKHTCKEIKQKVCDKYLPDAGHEKSDLNADDDEE